MKIKSIKLTSLIFLSAIYLLLWSHIKATNLPAFDGNAISLYIFIVYIISVLVAGKRLKFPNKHELTLSLILVVEVAIGLLFVTAGNTTIGGYSRFINGYLGFVIAYYAVKLYLSGNNKTLPLIKAMFWGSVTITIGLGLLQSLYIYAFHSSALHGLFEMILFRGTRYLDGGKVQLFTEPSLLGNGFYLIYMTSMLYLYENKVYRSRPLVIISIVLFVINLLGLSMRFIIDTGAFAAAYYFAKIHVTKGKRKYWNIILIVILLLALFLILYFDLFKLQERFPVFARLYRVVHLGVSRSDDLSSQARAEYIRCAWLGFLRKPIFGWGAGGFSQALRASHVTLSNSLAELEIQGAINSGNYVSYSLIFTQICECGLLGVAFVSSVYVGLIKKYRKAKSLTTSVLCLFIPYVFLQNEMIGFLVGAVVIALINYDVLEGRN